MAKDLTEYQRSILHIKYKGQYWRLEGKVKSRYTPEARKAFKREQKKLIEKVLEASLSLGIVPYRLKSWRKLSYQSRQTVASEYRNRKNG